jgi:hypothetical protein
VTPIANPEFPMEFAGLPWDFKRRDFERQCGLGRPQTGSALHHLVTSVSVKKALMDSGGFRAQTDRAVIPAPCACNHADRPRQVMLPAHTRPKCEGRGRLTDCAGGIVKE